MFLTAGDAVRIDMEKIWEETELFNGYSRIFTFKPELNTIYLCEHGLKHDFDQLVFLYEIERLIKCYNGRLAWGRLVALAKGFGLERIVYYGLYFVKKILAGDIPDESMEALRPKTVTLGEKTFIRYTLNNRRRRYSSYPVYLAGQKGVFKKSKFLFRTVFPPNFTVPGYLKRARNALAIFSPYGAH